MAKRRILIFSLAYPPFIGGAELAVKELTDRLPDADWTVITVNLDGRQPETERVGNVNVVRLGKGRFAKYMFPWQGAKRAAQLHARQPFDQVWSIMANQAGLAGLYFKRAHRDVPVLLTLQEGDSLASIWLRTWWMRRVYKAMYREADRVQAISTFLANRARQYGARGPITIVPNGVDLKNFRRGFEPTLLEKLRTTMGLTSEDNVVVTASRLVKKNGIATLIRSLQGTKFHLVVAGTGTLGARLRSLALDLGVNDRVHFVGHISHAELPAYLAIAQVFCRPSRSEGLGSAFIEAMAAGLPVVATKVGGIPDVVVDGHNGLFCEVTNPRDIGLKIDRLLTDAELYQTCKRGALATAERYEWDALAAEMRPLLGL